MKKCIFSLLAVAAMAAVSCVKENNPEAAPQENQNLVEVTLTAGTETKAAFDSENYPQIKWEGNESIAVLGATTGNREFTTTSTGATAEFTGLASLTDDVLYAVYPYDANVTLSGENLVGVTVPAVQTATAGSFDPKAYVAVAKCTDKATLSFKTLVSFLKFSLDDDAAANAKSVTVVANESYNLAATAASTSYSGLSHGGSLTNPSTSVTLKGDFVSGKDYFMTIRPSKLEGGITLYVEYADGSVYKKSTTKTLFPTDGERRNHVLPLGTINKSDLTEVNDLYALYSMGYDIKVGTKTYNKSTHTFELLNATKANDLAMRSKIHQKDVKVYLFVDSGEYNFELSSYTTIQSEVVVIGRYPNNPAKVSFTQLSRINSGSLAMKNLAITPLSGNRTIENVNSTADVSHLIFDNCKISGLNNSFVCLNKTNTINDIQFKDCDINVSGDDAVLVKSYVGNTYPSITYSNNIIYNSGALNGNFKLFCDNASKSSTVTSVIVDGNTFVNTYASTTYLIYTKTCSKITITDNLIYYPTAITQGTGYLRTISLVYPDEANRIISNNIAFCTDGTKAIRYLYDNVILGASNVNTITDGTNPFSTYNLANGIFVQSSTYASYGATR